MQGREFIVRKISSFFIATIVCLGLVGGAFPELLSSVRAEEAVYYFYNDHLGRPVKAKDEAGNVVWEGQHRPFGETEVTTEILEVNLRLPGQYYDKETGLHYNYQRTYHPGLGRYLEPDPLGQRDSPNVYPYAGSDPNNRKDPTGESVYSFKGSWNNQLNAWGVPEWFANIVSPIDPTGGIGPGICISAYPGAKAISGLAKATKGVRGVRYGPMNPGPLADDIANTFRSGSYVAHELDEATTLYRAIGDKGNPGGSYWTRAKPQGPLQSVVDSALDQNWGNTATSVIRAKVPAGTKVFEGAASAQRGLVGGGNQIYIPKVDSSWILP